MTAATNTASNCDIRIPIQRVDPLPSSSTNTTSDDTAANTTSPRALLASDLPAELSGIVSDSDFHAFCRTFNAYINLYDAILTRRKKLATQQMQCDMILFILVMLNLPSDNTKEFSMRAAILTLLHNCLYTALCLTAYFGMHRVCFRKLTQQVIDEQNEIYRNVITTCSDMSQRVTLTLPSSSPVTDVSCILGSKLWKDWIGSYNNMDYIEFTMTNAIEKTEDSDTSTPTSNHVVVSKQDNQISNAVFV